MTARKKEEWSVGDVWLSLLLLVTGGLVTTLTVLVVWRGHTSVVLLIAGIGGFLVGPLLLVIGVLGVVRSLWAARPRGDRAFIERRMALDEEERFGTDLDPPPARRNR